MKSVKSRVVWIDSMKLFACILVVLGHFYMSLASTGWISSKEFYYYYPVETVYTFHVPLFFVCSGYLYQRKRTDYTLASHWKNIKSKVLSLGIPYVAFSTITLVLKIIFHNSVNNQATPILRTLLWEPTAPYWYLYALFFIFCLIPRQQHRNQLWKIFCVSLIAKVIYICILWPFQLPDIITKVVGNAVQPVCDLLGFLIKRYGCPGTSPGREGCGQQSQKQDAGRHGRPHLQAVEEEPGAPG